MLLRLRNEELTERLRQLRFDLVEKEIELRIATDRHDANAAWLARKDGESVQAKIDQIVPKIDALSVVAPSDGIVHARGLESLLGTFVREGTEVARVVGDRPLQLLGAVRQDRVSMARANVGRNIPLRGPDRSLHLCGITSVEPRATDDVPAPSLAATLGGPLDVVRTDQPSRQGVEEEFRLTDPHFVVRAELLPSSATDLHSGMRVWMLLGNRNDTVGQRVAAGLQSLIFQTRAALTR